MKFYLVLLVISVLFLVGCAKKVTPFIAPANFQVDPNGSILYNNGDRAKMEDCLEENAEWSSLWADTDKARSLVFGTPDSWTKRVDGSTAKPTSFAYEVEMLIALSKGGEVQAARLLSQNPKLSPQQEFELLTCGLLYEYDSYSSSCVQFGILNLSN